MTQYYSLEGITLSAQVLINEETYRAQPTIEQSIIARTVNSFIISNSAAELVMMSHQGGEPMDDISEEDSASLMALARQNAKEIQAEQVKLNAAYDELIAAYREYMTIVQETIDINKDTQAALHDIIGINQQELDAIRALRIKSEKLLQEIDGLIKDQEVTLQKADSFLEQYAYLDKLSFHDPSAEDPGLFMNVMDQVILGNYSDKVTIEGTAAQVTLGLVGLDLPMDVRDTWYDLSNWEWSWGHAGQTGLDVIGFIPLAGMLKYGDEVDGIIKHEDELSGVAKACNCFTAGTKVLTDEGEKNIEDIDVGDKVLSKDEETGEVAYKEVTATFNHETDEIYQIHVGDQVIESTYNHPFWVEGKGWTYVKDLKVGDLLVQSDGNTLKIDSIEIVKKYVTVYNMTVDEFHTYFVSDLGIWVHNTGANPGSCLFGANGVQVTSKTIWKGNGSKARIDVENPNPGQRAGQIHYQDANNNKYLYDPNKKAFVDSQGNLAPKSVNKMLEDPNFVKKLNVGLTQYLGEDPYTP